MIAIHPVSRPLAACALALLLLLPLPARAGEPGLLREAMAVADRVMVALDLLGTPYRPRGNTPETGFDCSGFIRHVFDAANRIALPRSSDEMFRMDLPAIGQDALVAGDLLFFRIGGRTGRIDHVGMYLGEGRFVHAPASGGEVRTEALDKPYWSRHFAGARRVLSAAVQPGAVQDVLRTMGDNRAPSPAAGDMP